jgi:hypothetical protein
MSTPKPAGTHRQTLSFDVWSPDYFSSAQYEHIAIGIHGDFPLNFSNIEASTAHDGLGILLGESGCGQGATSVMIEAFSPTFSTVTGRCTPNVLKNNVTYSFRITVSDTAEISYTVREKLTNRLVSSDSLNAAGPWATYALSACSLAGRWRGRPRGCFTSGMASSRGNSSWVSWTLAPVRLSARGRPFLSTRR